MQRERFRGGVFFDYGKCIWDVKSLLAQVFGGN